MPLHHRDSISKTRLDALADAMFGVAMTLLIVDIRLPEIFDPKSGADRMVWLFDDMARDHPRYAAWMR